MIAVDAVAVANAALAEVGLPPIVEWYQGVPCTVGPADNPEVFRAGCLGLLAAKGPLEMVRCLCCWTADEEMYLENCVTVADALRGVTCGRQP